MLVGNRGAEPGERTGGEGPLWVPGNREWGGGSRPRGPKTGRCGVECMGEVCDGVRRGKLGRGRGAGEEEPGGGLTLREGSGVLGVGEARRAFNSCWTSWRMDC